MKHHFTALSKLFLLVFFVISCNNEKQKVDQFKIPEVTTPKKSTNKRQQKKKKGIEQIADYQRNIRKPINAEKSSYKKGYLIEAYDKAKKLAKTSNLSKKLATTFTERGPANVPGRTRDIAVDPTDDQRWFVGTVGGGVWLTENGGSTWSNVTDNEIPNLATSTVVISPQDENTLYAGTGEPFGNLDAIGGSGVFKTIDGGANWTSLSGTAAFGDVGRIIINPSDKDNVLIGTQSGIYRTTDGGTNWTQTYSGGNVQDLDATPGNFNILYGSVNGVGLVKSTDSGATWSLEFDFSTVNANHSRVETDISEVDTDVVILCVYSPGGGTQSPDTDLYMSRNAGTSFTNLTSTGTLDRRNLVGGQGWYDNIVLAHPFDENIFYVGGVELFKVTVNPINDTFTATEIAATQQNDNLNPVNTNVHVDQHGLVAIKRPAPNPNDEFRLILANDGGIHTTALATDPGVTDGSWTDAVNSKNSTQFYGADKRNTRNDYVGGAQDNGSWATLTNNTTSTSTYTRLLGGDGFECIWHYDNPNDLIVTAQNNTIVRYIDLTGALSPFPTTGPFYTKLANTNNNPNTVFTVTQEGVWRSTDFAGSWVLTPIGDNFGSQGNSSSLNVDVSIADPNIVWAGVAMTESGALSLHVSEDNGQTFSIVNSFIPTNGSHNVPISGIGNSPTNSQRAYALFSVAGVAKVLRTNNLGQSWEDISGISLNENRGFPDVAVHSIIEMPFNNGNTLWAGTDIGIFETTNGGTTWSLITNFLPVAVYDMKIVNDQVVIATHGRGIWSATLTELAGYEPPAYFGIPTIVSLNQESIQSLNAIATYQVPSDDVTRVKLFVDGIEVDEITQDFDANTDYQYTITGLSEGSFEFGIQAFDDNNTLATIINNRQGSVIDFNSSERALAINEFTTTDISSLDGSFLVNDLGGAITAPALNNEDHPYSNSRTYTSIIRTPLTIGATDNMLTYEDFAITEAGFDFVFIEGSTDLVNWTELDSYDASRFPEWVAEDAIATGGGTPTITDNLFKEQQIDLTSSFSENDQVVIRLRFVADALFTSYGWAIRSFKFNESSLSTDDITSDVDSFKVYPTISDGNFTISANSVTGDSSINIYDINGKKVFTTSVDFSRQEKHSLSLDLSSGVYILQALDANRKKTIQRFIIK